MVLSSCLERTCLSKVLHSKKIKYNDLDLIRPENREELAEDVFRKTGIRARDIEVESINFQDNTVNLILYYLEELASPMIGRRRLLRKKERNNELDNKLTLEDNVRTLNFSIQEKVNP